MYSYYILVFIMQGPHIGAAQLVNVIGMTNPTPSAVAQLLAVVDLVLGDVHTYICYTYVHMCVVVRPW